MQVAEIRTLYPEIAVTATILVVLLWDTVAPKQWRMLTPLIAGAGVVVAFLFLAGSVNGVAFGGTYVRDNLTQALQVIALLATLLALGLSLDYLRRFGLERGEYYALLLCACLGAMVMAASADLLVLFLGLETLSLPLYVLAAFARGSLRSQEAGLKYYLLGSFSTAFFLYGVALLYGASGQTTIAAVSRAAAVGLTPMLGGGIALLTIGLAFKAALVPFHAWAPDVYEGSPMPVTAFMAVVAKVGAFAALIRGFTVGLEALSTQWTLLLAILAGATMILGNLLAILQGSIKRMLAYSSIAHAGYLAMGVAAANRDGIWAVAFYLVVYLFMTLGAFAVVLLLERSGEEADAIEDYAGLGTRAPWMAAVMTVFMVSLAGLPPTAGFIGKLYLFNAALEGGQITLALVAALTTVVSVYYYLRVPYLMFVGRPLASVRLLAAPVARGIAIVAALATLLLGVFPGPLTDLIQPVADVLRR